LHAHRDVNAANDDTWSAAHEAVAAVHAAEAERAAEAARQAKRLSALATRYACLSTAVEAHMAERTVVERKTALNGASEMLLRVAQVDRSAQHDRIAALLREGPILDGEGDRWQEKQENTSICH
jgi:hypothetical protein